MEQGNRSDSTLMSDRQTSRDRIEPDIGVAGRDAAITDMLQDGATATSAEPSTDADLDRRMHEFAAIPFEGYEFDDALKTPQEWANIFSEQALAMHIADRTLRMTKPELTAFISNAQERDPATPEIMFRALDIAQDTFEGWGKLLNLARGRYLVAGCAGQVGDTDETALSNAGDSRLAVAATESQAEPTSHSIDPILALIEEARRLTAEHGRCCDISSRLPDSDPSHDATDDAGNAMWAHVRGVLLKTVPTTAEGCRALAQFTVEFSADEGVPVEADNNDAVIKLIAQSPLVAASLSSTQADALMRALLQAWTAYKTIPKDDTPEVDLICDQAFDRVSDIAKEIARLPATIENLPAKAVALAWIEAAELLAGNKPREDYCTNGRLAYDICQVVTGDFVRETAA